MKKLSALLALALLPAALSAASYRWLNFSMTDGSLLSVAAENLNMNYVDGSLLLSSETVNEKLVVSSLASMYFSDDKTSVDELLSAETEISEVYSPNGMKLGQFRDKDEARAKLPSGIYIIRQGSQTTKVIF